MFWSFPATPRRRSTGSGCEIVLLHRKVTLDGLAVRGKENDPVGLHPYTGQPELTSNCATAPSCDRMAVSRSGNSRTPRVSILPGQFFVGEWAMYGSALSYQRVVTRSSHRHPTPRIALSKKEYHIDMKGEYQESLLDYDFNE